MVEKNTTQIAVLETADREHLSTCSLVLTSVAISHDIIQSDDGYSIYVAQHEATTASYHLSSYIKENKGWPPEKLSVEHPVSQGQPPTLLIIGALATFYFITGPWNPETVWFSSGAGDSGAILYGQEYFRLVTALTLHADLNHLLGNCFLGGFLLHFFCKTVGSGIGLAALLLSSVLGNFVNVYLRGEGHLFVGYSTAVFATIGMLVMVSYHTNRKLSRFRVFLPFMAGAALLAMTGSSGERTDLGAHFFGLLSGFAIGRVLISRFFIHLRRSSFLQFVLFGLTLSVVYLSWAAALDKVY